MPGYPQIKRAQILHHLTPAEQEEVERLEARQRQGPKTQARLAELWGKAFDLHHPEGRPWL